MKIVFSVLLTCLLYLPCTAQSDLLLFRKNNRTIQTFFPGTEMRFSTESGFYQGYVTTIDKDSVFLVQYDIRKVFTTMGVFILDTVAEYHFAVNYHNIKSFGKDDRKFNWKGSMAGLFGGGVVITTAGLITWIFAEPKTRYYASPYLVMGAAAIAVVGYLSMQSGSKGIKLGKKYSLKYVDVN